MLAWMDAAMWAVYGWHGVGPGDRRLRFWGLAQAGAERVKRRVADALTGQLRLSAFEIDPVRSSAYFARALRFRARYAYGYPTLIARWAAQCADQGLSGKALGLRCVITTGELLSHANRDFLAGFFGCRIVNEYGCSESGILAFQCESGTAHIIPVAAWPEVVDSDGPAFITRHQGRSRGERSLR
jgi:phenylacetate-CoA ligase